MWRGQQNDEWTAKPMNNRVMRRLWSFPRFDCLEEHMNTDIRLSINFWTHPKTVKLERRLGLEGVRSLQILWLWAARNRADGRLSKLDAEAIEIVADWRGASGKFVETALELVWLEEDDEGYRIHDWQEHNGWAADYLPTPDDNM